MTHTALTPKNQRIADTSNRNPTPAAGTQRHWFISELYYPETAATGFILTRLAEGLAARGSNVHVLCGQPTYRDRGTHAARHEVHNGVEIFRCAATTLNKDILPLRVINLLTITLSLFFAALRRLRKGDRVLVVTNPPSLPFLVSLACKLRGAQCTLLIHDVYPEVLVASGKLAAGSVPARTMGWLNRRLYNSVETIIVIGRDMQQAIAAKLKSRPERVKVVTNWADLEFIAPKSRTENELLKELGLQEKFVLQYAGNMGHPNDIESIIEAATLLAENPRIHFMFIGSGAKKHWIEQEVNKRNLANVSMLSTRPRSDQPNFLNACDAALISLMPGMKGVSVPSRTYNTLASGKAVMAIAEVGSELALVVEEEQAGWVVPPGKPQQLAEAILAADADRDALRSMGANARAAAERSYSFARVLEEFSLAFAPETPSSVDLQQTVKNVS